MHAATVYTHVHVSYDDTTKICGLQVLSDYIFYNNSSYNIIAYCNNKVCQFMFPYKVIFTNTNFF